MIDAIELFKEQVNLAASDLHLKVGRPPIFRIVGEMVTSKREVVSAEDMESVLKQILGDVGYGRLTQENEMDFAYMVPNVARFRINAFRHLGQFGLVARSIPFKPPTFDKYVMPPVLKDLLAVPQGMILVTGPTGSGKSTTLACMVEHLNERESLHIVTAEDPIEFLYVDAKCTIRQRQVGTDVANFRDALRRILRQDPDVIMIGEMRDRETIEMAMHAAETGHLVLSTLHTNDAKQTLDRIVEFFPADMRDHTRSVLAMSLHAVVSQRMLRRADGTARVAAMEVLINTPHIRDLILQNKIREIEGAMKTGSAYRMQTFNQSLAKLVADGLVKEEDAMATSSNANELQMLLRGITGGGVSQPAAVPGGRVVPPLPPATPRPAPSPVPSPTPRPQMSPLRAPQPAPPPGTQEASSSDEARRYRVNRDFEER